MFDDITESFAHAQAVEISSLSRAAHEFLNLAKERTSNTPRKLVQVKA